MSAIAVAGLLAGCGSADQSTAGDAETTQRAAATGTAVTCAEQKSKPLVITIRNTLDAPIIVDSRVTCAQWSGGKNPSAANGREIAAGGSLDVPVAVATSGNCGRWSIAVKKDGTTAGPAGLRLCRPRVTESSPYYNVAGDLHVESNGEWVRIGPVGQVTDSSGSTRDVVASTGPEGYGPYLLTIAYRE